MPFDDKLDGKGGIVIPFQEGEAVAISDEQRHFMRILEACLFASKEPLTLVQLQSRLEHDVDMQSLISDLQNQYKGRGVELVEVAGGYAFRTAPDLSFLLQQEAEEKRKLSRAAQETLAIIAYHQPVTRAEIEEIRGVSISKGTLDVLLETGWIRMRGRRRSPGRPVTYGTTALFLDYFSLEDISDLPGLEELKGAGLLDSAIPVNFKMPLPCDDDDLNDDEDPLEQEDLLAYTGLIDEVDKA